MAEQSSVGTVNSPLALVTTALDGTTYPAQLEFAPIGGDNGADSVRPRRTLADFPFLPVALNVSVHCRRLAAGTSASVWVPLHVTFAGSGPLHSAGEEDSVQEAAFLEVKTAVTRPPPDGTIEGSRTRLAVGARERETDGGPAAA